MDVKQVAKNTVKTVISYLTYEAVRTVFAQLDQTDPPRAYWLHQFSSRDKIQNGEAYLEALFQESPDLAFRILTVREALAQEIVEFLPEMILTGVQQSNMNQRRQQLERMTQMELTSIPQSDETDLLDDSHPSSTE